MTTRRGAIAGGAALLAACAGAPRAGQGGTGALAGSGPGNAAGHTAALAEVDALVASAGAAQRMPGVAYAVLQRGQVLQAAGLGLANVEHAVPVTRSTLFQTGSLGKQFTAVAVMLLVEQGRLGLDDPVGRFLPDAPAAWRTMTVRHLLTHTSGLPDYDERTLDYRRDHSEDELLRVVYGLPLGFAPGAQWRYGGTGYAVLGILIRKASGQFYGELLRERVFRPLGMTGARVISEEDIVPHRAAGYRLVDGVLKNQAWVAPSLNTTADGSLYLSLDDWLRWAQALRQRAVLQPASWAQVFTPVRLNDGRTHPYGLGWELQAAPGLAGYRHEGAWQGFRTAWLHAAEADVTVIVLCNLAQAEPMPLAERIAQALGAAPAPAGRPGP